ncbi:MAG TPA: twin-arginine translocation signal domain-containing protein [Gemmatimonadales bacterium]|nr:twin-arginine translocation signal domain-containing protein [Gemmatimonadales bacterium]
MTSRRDFLQQSAITAVGLTIPATGIDVTGPDRGLADSPGFLDLLRPPDSVMLQAETGDRPLRPVGAGRWTDEDVAVTTIVRPGVLAVELSAPATGAKRLRLRWRGPMSEALRVLGDAWERGYGDLEWRGMVPDRVMPWYFATKDGTLTHSYGVRTGAQAFCFWQLDQEGISLWADVRSGGVGVRLGERVLAACEVVCRAGHAGETAHAALHAFCRQMCPNPRLPRQPVYGSNDWYWAYGKNSAESVLADAQRIVELSPAGANRPFAVIDDGWQPGRGATETGTGAWDRGNEKFPDMAALAAAVRSSGARPGIWTRPLQAGSDVPDTWRLPRDREVLDPTVPEVAHKIGEDIARLRLWGYELIKHDYSTYDIFGRWGFQMGAALTRDGWTFAAGASQTTAEVIHELYRTISRAAGASLVIGCNTVSHLSAGYFEICRVGDDTSGTEWSRTRKMGVNTLAFRGLQHGAFYAADPDCVGVTTEQPWGLNRQWLDLVARSGTALFVSLAPDALGADQRRDLGQALALAAQPQPLAEPLDWERTVYSTRWRLMGRQYTYNWVGPEGAGLP